MKKRKEKERNKKQLILPNKRHSFKKRETHNSKEYQKYLELELYEKKFHTLAHPD